MYIYALVHSLYFFAHRVQSPTKPINTNVKGALTSSILSLKVSTFDLSRESELLLEYKEHIGDFITKQ